jgi:hypothetical protein
MNVYKFFKVLCAGLILACFWLMIGMIFTQSTNLNPFVQGVTAFMWFFTYGMLIIEEEVF